MAVTDSPYVERLLENAYVQDNLLEAVENLRRAYERAQKRRVEPARDSKIRHQLRQAALSLTEAGEALKSGRRKPRKRWPKRMFVLVAAIGVAAALAGSKDLRSRLVGSDSFAGEAVQHGGLNLPSLAHHLAREHDALGADSSSA